MLDKIDLELIVEIAQKAGDAIMEIYEKDFQIKYKDDNSPLTEADIASNKIICDALAKAYPVIPLLSEENKTVLYDVRKDWEYFWLIDPIDGTKEFIRKNGEFTVNIALIYKNTPVLGVVYAPVLKEMYKAKQGEGAFKNDQKLPLKTDKDPKETLTVVASKSHLTKETKRFIEETTANIKNPKFISKGSSLKLVMVAEGSADIYPRLAPTMEWDTAAADAVVRESGKMTYQFKNNIPLVYNKEKMLNPWFVVK